MTVFESLLNNTFAVERRQRVSDGQGGWIVVYVAVGTVEGRICPTSSKERVVADAEQQQITHVLYVAAGEDVARGDRVTYADADGVHPLAVEVLGIREPSEAGTHWEIDCLERQYEEVGEEGS